MASTSTGRALQLKHLPKAGPWLLKYWQQSVLRWARATWAMLPLIEQCVSEHIGWPSPPG